MYGKIKKSYVHAEYDQRFRSIRSSVDLYGRLDSSESLGGCGSQAGKIISHRAQVHAEIS